MQAPRFRIYYTWSCQVMTEEFAAPGLVEAVGHAEARCATLPRGSYFEIWHKTNLLSASGDCLPCQSPALRVARNPAVHPLP